MPFISYVFKYSTMTNKLAMLGLSMVAVLALAATMSYFTPAVFALQVVGQKNNAGGNTQKGLVNVGNAQVDVGANVCALSNNC